MYSTSITSKRLLLHRPTEHMYDDPIWKEKLNLILFRLEYKQPLYISFKGIFSQVNYDTPMKGLLSEQKCRKLIKVIQGYHSWANL